MKFSPLLKQFLYQNKRLDLPRIGTFQLNELPHPYPESHKQNPEAAVEVVFKFDPLTAEDPELVSFISANTGKMKALASSDLNSFIEISIQFLNIGKFFKLEGIGSLVKTQQNEYAFTPEKLNAGKVLDAASKEMRHPNSEKNDFSNFDSINIENKKPPFSIKKLIIVLFSIAGLALIGWGIYYLYIKNEKRNLEKEIQNISTIVPVFEDSLQSQSKPPDSVKTDNLLSAIKSYNFILEVSERQRAFSRYKQLKSYKWNILMTTNDSILYKLYIRMPAMPADTNRIKDSLNLLTGRKIRIEK